MKRLSRYEMIKLCKVIDAVEELDNYLMNDPEECKLRSDDIHDLRYTLKELANNLIGVIDDEQ